MKSLNSFGIFMMILSSMALLEDKFFISDLLVSFKFQYLWIFLILLLVNLVYKKKGFAASYLIMSLINFVSIYPTWSSTQDLKCPDFKIYFANILTSNKKHSLLIESILKQKPDIVVLQEVNKKWEHKLAYLSDNYKHQIMLSREHNFGMAIFSKLEILDHEIFQGKAEVESVLLKINFKNKDINILATHPVPPINLNYWNLRNNQYKELRGYLNKVQGENILLGDLNAVSWSSHLKQLSKDTGLNPVNTFRDTWNSVLPPGMRIRPDHAFVSKNLKGALKVLDNIGSDHLPMLLSLKI
ncbi:MAG: endonuclease/exonuclease/phosphatase family protein [Bacteriovoracales bacterium]|nr:endonuclease/exonuclease/phosphatase family protein [Bacteriovoracales bacterium]